MKSANRFILNELVTTRFTGISKFISTAAIGKVPVSAPCRSLPPAIRFSVTANEKTQAQIIYANG